MSFATTRVKNISIPLERINAIYIIFVAVLCYASDVPEIAKGFLAIPLYLMIPYFIGYIIYKFFSGFEGDSVFKTVICWSLGIITLTLIALLLNLVNLFNTQLYVGFITAIVIIDNLVHKNIFISVNKNHIPILLSFLIGLITVIFLSDFSPYPLMPASDPFRHNQYTLILAETNYMLFSQSYLPTFYILLSIPTVILNAYSDSFSFFWGSRFLLYPLYSVGLYLFSYKLSNNKVLSILSSVIGSFAAVMGFALYGFAPKAVVYLLFPFFMYLIHDTYQRCRHQIQIKEINYLFLLTLINILFLTAIFFLSFEYFRYYTILLLMGDVFAVLAVYAYSKNSIIQSNFLLLSIIALTLMLFHIPMGLISLILIMIYFFVPLYSEKYNLSSFVYAAIILAFFFILLQKFEFIDLADFKIYLYNLPYTFDNNFSGKYGKLIDIYSSLILSLSSIGILFYMVRRKEEQLGILLVITVTLLFYFFPISFIYRILLAATPVLAHLSSYTIIKWHDIFINKSFARNTKSVVFFLLIIVILIPNIMVPYTNQIEWFTSKSGTHGHFTFFEPYEYEAAKWVKENTPKDTLVISDPFTQYVFSGISYRKEVIGVMENKSRQNMVFDILDSPVPNMREKIDVLLMKKDLIYFDYRFYPKKFENLDASKMNVIIVISGRTLHWMEYYSNSTKVDVNIPHDIADDEHIAKFINTTHITPIYYKDNIHIFRVN